LDTMMTISDLALKMQLTEAAIRKFVWKKQVPYVKVGASIRFDPDEIAEWLKSKKQAYSENESY